MKKSNPKIKLSKKTISRLTNLQMHSVRGGILPGPNETAASDCCTSNLPPTNFCSSACPTGHCGGGGGASGYTCNCGAGGNTGLCTGDVTCE